MLSAALTRALTTPAFVAADFVPTHWDSAEQKAKFANALLTFVAQDFSRSKFMTASIVGSRTRSGTLPVTIATDFMGASS